MRAHPLVLLCCRQVWWVGKCFLDFVNRVPTLPSMPESGFIDFSRLPRAWLHSSKPVVNDALPHPSKHPRMPPHCKTVTPRYYKERLYKHPGAPAPACRPPPSGTVGVLGGNSRYRFFFAFGRRLPSKHSPNVRVLQRGHHEPA